MKGYLYILAAATLWGMIGPISKLAFQQGLLPMEVAFWRSILAWFFFGMHAILLKQVRIEKHDFAPVLIFGVTGVTLFYGSYQLSVHINGAAVASVLLYTAPAWVIILSRIFFKESITFIKLFALFLTLTGVAGVSLGSGNLVITDGMNLNFYGLIAGLFAGFFYSLYYIFGKYFSGHYSAPNLFLYILPIGALGIFPWVEFAHKTPVTWAALMCLAFFCTYGAYYFYYIGLKHLEATRAAITATIEPIIAACVAYLWWNEYFNFRGYAGSFLILSGVLLIVREGRKQPLK